MTRVTRVLIDANIFLDYFLVRQHYDLAERIFKACDDDVIEGYTSATIYHIVFHIGYTQRKDAELRANPALANDPVAMEQNEKDAMKKAMEDAVMCLNSFSCCPVDEATIRLATQLPGEDLEDNIQIACAMNAGLDAIVTRDRKFAQSNISILRPEALLRQIGRLLAN